MNDSCPTDLKKADRSNNAQPAQTTRQVNNHRSCSSFSAYSWPANQLRCSSVLSLRRFSCDSSMHFNAPAYHDHTIPPRPPKEPRETCIPRAIWPTTLTPYVHLEP